MSSSVGWMAQEQQRLCQLSDRIYAVAGNLTILSRLAWPLSVKEGFFRNGQQRLPEVAYEPFDGRVLRQSLLEVQQDLGDTPVDLWMSRTIDTLLMAGEMLEARGTERFFQLSCQIYGRPTDMLRDEKTSSLDLARRYLTLLKPMELMDLGRPPEACMLASTLAERMKQANQDMFGDEAPEVQIVDELSANALASSERVRIRRQACFSDKDIEQLIHHEIYIHVATILNGKTPGNLSLLALAHPGSTKTQEGLAVFAEFISGTLDLDRMRRLADRVVAIQMAIDGADFIEVYRFFLEKTDNPDQSFENARRVFRGGVVSGGAPFTKDIVYLDGLLRVHNFMRAAVNAGRADCLHLLFAGRLDIEDLPVLSYLRNLNLCQKPRFLPPWAKDLRFLLCYLSYSSFLNSVDMSRVSAHYQAMLADVGQIY
jgi:uncharacterized protein (TIGR02421 family)